MTKEEAKLLLDFLDYLDGWGLAIEDNELLLERLQELPFPDSKSC